jgi:hypothetical protein
MTHFSERIHVVKGRVIVKCPFRIAPISTSGGTNQMLGYGSWPTLKRHFDSFRKFWFSFLRVVHQIWYTFLCTLWHHKYDAWLRFCCLCMIIASDWTTGVSCHWLRMCRARSTGTVWCTEQTQSRYFYITSYKYQTGRQNIINFSNFQDEYLFTDHAWLPLAFAQLTKSPACCHCYWNITPLFFFLFCFFFFSSSVVGSIPDGVIGFFSLT